MKRFMILFILAVALLLSACGAADDDHDHDHAPGTGIETHDAWTRAALKDGNSAAYMLLHNHSTEDDALVGASSDVATTTEIELSQAKADGTVEMTPQESIALPEDSEVEIKPGGYHVMLIGLKKDLNVGDEITLTLHFMHHEDIILKVPVLDAAGPDNSGMDDMDMHTPTP